MTSLKRSSAPYIQRIVILEKIVFLDYSFHDRMIYEETISISFFSQRGERS